MCCAGVTFDFQNIGNRSAINPYTLFDSFTCGWLTNAHFLLLRSLQFENDPKTRKHMSIWYFRANIECIHNEIGFLSKTRNSMRWMGYCLWSLLTSLINFSMKAWWWLNRCKIYIKNTSHNRRSQLEILYTNFYFRSMKLRKWCCTVNIESGTWTVFDLSNYQNANNQNDYAFSWIWVKLLER